MKTIAMTLLFFSLGSYAQFETRIISAKKIEVDIQEQYQMFEESGFIRFRGDSISKFDRLYKDYPLDYFVSRYKVQQEEGVQWQVFANSPTYGIPVSQWHSLITEVNESAYNQENLLIEPELKQNSFFFQTELFTIPQFYLDIDSYNTRSINLGRYQFEQSARLQMQFDASKQFIKIETQPCGKALPEIGAIYGRDTELRINCIPGRVSFRIDLSDNNNAKSRGSREIKYIENIFLKNFSQQQDIEICWIESEKECLFE